MKKVKSKLLILFLFLPYILSHSSVAFSKAPLLIYYGDNVTLSYLKNFKVVVLEPDNYDNVSILKKIKDNTRYAYCSIGEVSSSRKYFSYVKDKLKVLKSQNPHWKGSFFIDLTSGKWQNYVIKNIIPKIFSKGFDGIFLDTVDSLLLNNKKELVINFINLIKKQYPNLKLFMNRGLNIINKVNIDAILLESYITSYDFKNKSYFFIKTKGNYNLPDKLKIFSLDYWNVDDYETIKKIYQKALKLGFKPFVTDIKLTIIPKLLYDEDLKQFIYVKP